MANATIIVGFNNVQISVIVMNGGKHIWNVNLIDVTPALGVNYWRL
jgi:hypothetical protein